MKPLLLVFTAAVTLLFACKKSSTTTEPFATGTWKAYAQWVGPNPDDWQPVSNGQTMTFSANGTYEIAAAGSTEAKFTGRWKLVTDKPDDVPAGAHLIELQSNEYVAFPGYLVITFLAADEITAVPYYRPADRPLINTTGPAKYRRH